MDRATGEIIIPAAPPAEPVMPVVAQSSLYRVFQRDLSPPWLQQEWGKQWQEELGAAKDRLVDWLVLAVRARFIAAAPDDALALIGQDRRMPRFPSEGANAYRARLLRAWDWWFRSGTREGMVRALALLGYQATIREPFPTLAIAPVWSDTDGVWRDDGVWRNDPWALFSLILRQGNPQYTAEFWSDDGVWTTDAPAWGGVISSSEIARILGVINGQKPAHTVCVSIIYVAGGVAWGEDTGPWTDDGPWSAGDVSVIYQR